MGPWVTHAPLHNIKNSHTFLGRQNCPCWNDGVFFPSNEQHLFYLDRWDVEGNSYHRKTLKLASIYAWVPYWLPLKDVLAVTQGTPWRENGPKSQLRLHTMSRLLWVLRAAVKKRNIVELEYSFATCWYVFIWIIWTFFIPLFSQKMKIPPTYFICNCFHFTLECILNVGSLFLVFSNISLCTVHLVLKKNIHINP